MSASNETPTVAIIGDGQMGIVFANILAQQGANVRLWGRSADHVALLQRDGESRRHLPGYPIHPAIMITADEHVATECADLIVCAVPTQHIRSVFTRIAAAIPADIGVVSSSKGIENRTLLRPTQVIAQAVDGVPDDALRPLAALSGPTIADELARRLPATMIAASDNPSFATLVQRMFSCDYLRIYTLTDLTGVELAGATKNVIAIAAGIVDGLNIGYNAKSALLSRGLSEIAGLGSAMGARAETFFGIAGVGDLATTCFSPLGRNRSCGEALGKGTALSEYLTSTQSVVEGVATTQSVVELAQQHDVEMPITQAVHDVLFEDVHPREAIHRLMDRDLKAERIG